MGAQGMAIWPVCTHSPSRRHTLGVLCRVPGSLGIPGPARVTRSGTHLLTECGVHGDSCYLNIEQRAWHAVNGLAVQCTAAWLMALRTIECTFALCRAECLLPPGPTVELARTLAGKWRSLDFSPVSFLGLHPLCGHVLALALRAMCGLSPNQAPPPLPAMEWGRWRQKENMAHLYLCPGTRAVSVHLSTGLIRGPKPEDSTLAAWGLFGLWPPGSGNHACFLSTLKV